jgi:predicted PurR-regulated permease PerM
MNHSIISKSVLLILLFFISTLFILMIKSFILIILLAGIFSALLHPLYQRLVRLLYGKKMWASLITLLLLLLVILLPLTSFLGIVTTQAIHVGMAVKTWVAEYSQDWGKLEPVLTSLPFYDQLKPYKQDIITKLGSAVASISTFILGSLSSVTVMTVNFVILSFIFLYVMFFFLQEGESVLNKLLYYLPLEDREERRLLDKFTSVTRATLKGTAVIGILQGGLAGLAFWIVGIPQAVFWGMVMTVLSVIPSIGTGLVWFPASLILAARGEYLAAVGLLLFCGLIVSSLDNILRPRLVGKDTQMHDLLIFLGTLGGLSMFGIIGFIVGPIIVALFVTLWDIYGEAFREYLPKVGKVIPALPQTTPKKNKKKS